MSNHFKQLLDEALLHGKLNQSFMGINIYIYFFLFFLPLHANSYTLHGLNICVLGTRGLEKDSRHLTGSEEEKQIEEKCTKRFFISVLVFYRLQLHSDKTIYVADK